MKKRLLSVGDTVGLIACSDGLKPQSETLVNNVIESLTSLGLNVVLADTLYRTSGSFSGTPEKRASELVRLFKEPEICAIFDLSGGDTANQILPYIDFDSIKKNPKPFSGLSDLSVLLNGITHCSGVPTYHYQIRNLVGEHRDQQLDYFKKTYMDGMDTEYHLEWIRGNKLEGAVIGGNLRCFLKLVGTDYCPDFKDKVLFLESLGGRDNRIASYLAQLKQIGAFNQIKGIILGTFSQMEGEQIKPTVEELLLELTGEFDFPIVKTRSLGHGSDAVCIGIGEEINLER